MDINIVNEVRELEREDIILERVSSLMATLENLSSLDGLTPERAYAKLVEFVLNPAYHIFVAVHPDGIFIGTATLFIEEKLIHNCGRVGHIEDVATHKNYERQGVGGAVIRAALSCAWRNGCYKVVLDCNEHNVPWYENLGFRRHEICMRIDAPKK